MQTPRKTSFTVSEADEGQDTPVEGIVASTQDMEVVTSRTGQVSSVVSSKVSVQLLEVVRLVVWSVVNYQYSSYRWSG